MPPAENSPDDVQRRLQKLIEPLLAQAGGSRAGAAESIAVDVPLSELGLTSVDFLELVLAVEKEFDLEILDTLAPDELPLTAGGWQQFVSARLAGKA